MVSLILLRSIDVNLPWTVPDTLNAIWGSCVSPSVIDDVATPGKGVLCVGLGSWGKALHVAMPS